MVAAVKKSKAEYSREWRQKMIDADPLFLEREREKARARSNAAYLKKKQDPEWVAAENERKRAYAAKKRAEKGRSEKPLPMTDEAKAKQAERMKKWREANKAHIQDYSKKWKEKNAEHVSEYAKAYMQVYKTVEDVKERINARRLIKYNLTPSDFNEIWEAQNGECAICGVALKPRGRTKDSACVDHNHATGEVRGLLCRACNHGIGNLKDSPFVLESAAKYLTERGFYGPATLHRKKVNHG